MCLCRSADLQSVELGIDLHEAAHLIAERGDGAVGVLGHRSRCALKNGERGADGVGDGRAGFGLLLMLLGEIRDEGEQCQRTGRRR